MSHKHKLTGGLPCSEDESVLIFTCKICKTEFVAHVHANRVIEVEEVKTNIVETKEKMLTI